MGEESERIKLVINKLRVERVDLINQLKPVPEGRRRKKFEGICLSTGKKVFSTEIIYNNEVITLEKLKKIRKEVKTHNKPLITRINKIDKQLPILQEKLNQAEVDELLNDSIKEKKGKTSKELEKLKGDNESINRELSIAHDKLKAYKKRHRFKNIPEENELKRIIEKSKKKNGKINYSAVGKEFGVDHQMSKRWCVNYNIT